MEELTAQFCEKMFSMEESMQPVLADVQQNHKGLWAKIKDFFRGFIEKVRKLIEAGETAQKFEALQVWESISEEMQKVFAAKWGEALRSAKQTHDAVTGLEAAGILVEGIKNTAQEVGEQFSVRSIVGQSGTNYGIGVYLDSTLLEGLSEDERVEMVKERIKELGGQAFTAYDGAGNAVQIRIAQPSQRFRNANGKRVRVNKDLTEKFNRNSVKQEAVVLVDELISTAKEGQPNPARHPHGWLDDNGQNPWFKWTTYIQEKNGSVWLAYFNIATATDGTKHLYDVDPIKIVEQAGTSATSPQQQNAAGNRVPQNAANVNPINEQHQTRPRDTVSDVELLLQQKVEDATNREQGRLLKEFQAKARQVQELEAKLEQAKAQLKRTDRSYNTRGIQKLIGDTMKTFGMGDAKNVGIRKTAAEMLNKAYDKAIAAIDRGDSAGALDEVYQGAVSVAEYLSVGRNMISRKRRSCTMKTPLFRGTCTALVTPFSDAGIDYAALDRLLDKQLEAGIEALVICGTTGEAATLEPEETLAVIAHCVRYCGGKTKLIAGIGGNHTKKTVHMAKAAAALGVDGLLSVTPYYNKCTQAGLIAHYSEIAAATELPLILYNVPSRTTVDITPETCAQLAKLPTVNGIKEANPDVGRVLKLRQLCGEDFPIYCGNDDRILPFMVCGALGVISVLSNLRPKAVKELTDACLRGEFARALALQQDQQPLIEELFSQVNPIPIKAALRLSGLDAGNCRLPLTPPTEDLLERLQPLL